VLRGTAPGVAALLAGVLLLIAAGLPAVVLLSVLLRR
jgi:hypothetical protein